jgi:hypothetical protein
LTGPALIAGAVAPPFTRLPAFVADSSLTFNRLVVVRFLVFLMTDYLFPRRPKHGPTAPPFTFAARPRAGRSLALSDFVALRAFVFLAIGALLGTERSTSGAGS